jgi:hypothetical protein
MVGVRHTQSRSIATRLSTEQGFSTHDSKTSVEKIASLAHVARPRKVDSAQKPTLERRTAIRAATVQIQFVRASLGGVLQSLTNGEPDNREALSLVDCIANA